MDVSCFGVRDSSGTEVLYVLQYLDRNSNSFYSRKVQVKNFDLRTGLTLTSCHTQNRSRGLLFCQTLSTFSYFFFSSTELQSSKISLGKEHSEIKILRHKRSKSIKRTEQTIFAFVQRIVCFALNEHP